MISILTFQHTSEEDDDDKEEEKRKKEGKTKQTAIIKEHLKPGENIMNRNEIVCKRQKYDNI